MVKKLQTKHKKTKHQAGATWDPSDLAMKMVVLRPRLARIRAEKIRAEK